MSFLIIPLVMTVFYTVTFGLGWFHITNPIIVLSSICAILHLVLTGYLYTQIQRKANDTQVPCTNVICQPWCPVYQIASFSAFILTLSTTFAYLILGFFPIVRFPFFMLKWLPYSSYWLDAFLIAIPPYLLSVVGDNIFSTRSNIVDQ